MFPTISFPQFASLLFLPLIGSWGCKPIFWLAIWFVDIILKLFLSVNILWMILSNFFNHLLAKLNSWLSFSENLPPKMQHLLNLPNKEKMIFWSSCLWPCQKEETSDKTAAVLFLERLPWKFYNILSTTFHPW